MTLSLLICNQKHRKRFFFFLFQKLLQSISLSTNSGQPRLFLLVFHCRLRTETFRCDFQSRTWEEFSRNSESGSKDDRVSGVIAKRVLSLQKQRKVHVSRPHYRGIVAHVFITRLLGPNVNEENYLWECFDNAARLFVESDTGFLDRHRVQQRDIVVEYDTSERLYFVDVRKKKNCCRNTQFWNRGILYTARKPFLAHRYKNGRGTFIEKRQTKLADRRRGKSMTFRNVSHALPNGLGRYFIEWTSLR